MESCDKNISNIFNVTLTLKKFQKHKKIEKIHMDSEKLINLFEINKDSSPGYLCDNYFFSETC